MSRPLAIVALAGGLACRESGLQPDPVAAVEITSPTGTVTLATLGRRIQFTAEARDAAGQVLPGSHIKWNVTKAAAAISDSGVLTALTPGTLSVWASAGGMNSAPVAVTIDPVAISVTMTPESLTFHSTGPARAVHVEVRDSSGALLAEIPSLVTEDPTVARTSSSGNVSAVAEGVTRLVATTDGIADTTLVTVALVPARIRTTPSSLVFGTHTLRTLLPAVLDSASNPIAGYPVSFSSDDTTLATVSAAGEVTPHGEGNTQVRVAAGSVVAAVPVSMHYVIASVQILPSHMTFYTVGRPQHAELYALDSTGVIIGRLPDSTAGRVGLVTWHPFGWYFSVVPSGTGADVYPEYQYDFDLLNANYAGIHEGYALISVWWYPVTFGIVAPQTSFAVGDTGTLSIVARDSLNNDLNGRAPFFWVILDQSVVSLDGTLGLPDATLTALKPGTTWIQMFGAGRIDSVFITVH
ncbi:MAG: hypothetical protein ABI742_04535 [Gemmatimonadota bacterium]